jgi:G1/S-specific cyclin PLC1
MPCTRHRVFLATLIVAAKYLNDSSPKNKHWAHYAALFDTAELNLMEKQLIYLLDYDLRFDEAEAVRHFEPFFAAAAARSPKETRAAAVERVARSSRTRLGVAVAQAPPTPPADAAALPQPPVLAVPSPAAPPATGAYLVVPAARPHVRARTAPTVPPPPPSNASSASLGTTMTDDSEPGSLTEDNGTSSSSASSDSELEPETCDEAAKPTVSLLRSPARVGAGLRKFVLRPVPPRARVRGRHQRVPRRRPRRLASPRASRRARRWPSPLLLRGATRAGSRRCTPSGAAASVRPLRGAAAAAGALLRTRRCRRWSRRARAF